MFPFHSSYHTPLYFYNDSDYGLYYVGHVANAERGSATEILITAGQDLGMRAINDVDLSLLGNRLL